MIKLLALKFKVACLNGVEYAQVVFRYYKYPKFARADLALLSLYFFQNPFKISRKFHQKRGDEEVYVYGETPLTTLDLIAQKGDIQSSDVVYELGSGRGRTAFWLWGVLGCKVFAIEEIPDYVTYANQIVQRQKLENIAFINNDFLKTQLSKGNVFYLYGSALSDDTITALAARFKKGDKIITVSYPLTDYHPDFRVTHQFPAPFTWGWADVYIQIKR